jgi:GNAT superfamily N-acetyltransferase
MPIATRHRDDHISQLTSLPSLTVRRELDATVMAALQGKPAALMIRRFEAGHRAYIALWNGEPAAWGWVATRSAEIGELDSSFVIPSGERYLWNFVTSKAHRGKGIYPRLLDAIVRAESSEATRFWIAYAPENHASGSGIRKAGFVAVAELSFDGAGRPALEGMIPDGSQAAARVFGLPVAPGPLASCWRCARAAKAAVTSCSTGVCSCDYQRPEIGCAA